MRKRILSGLFALALLTTAGFGVKKSMKSEAGLSDLALANVEALAELEKGVDWDCSYSSNTVCYYTNSSKVWGKFYWIP